MNLSHRPCLFSAPSTLDLPCPADHRQFIGSSNGTWLCRKVKRGPVQLLGVGNASAPGPQLTAGQEVSDSSRRRQHTQVAFFALCFVGRYSGMACAARGTQWCPLHLAMVQVNYTGLSLSSPDGVLWSVIFLNDSKTGIPLWMHPANELDWCDRPTKGGQLVWLNTCAPNKVKLATGMMLALHCHNSPHTDICLFLLVRWPWPVLESGEVASISVPRLRSSNLTPVTACQKGHRAQLASLIHSTGVFFLSFFNHLPCRLLPNLQGQRTEEAASCETSANCCTDLACLPRGEHEKVPVMQQPAS